MASSSYSKVCISLAGAKQVGSHALEEAEKLGVAACASVVDSSGRLVWFERMDGTTAISIAMSQRKAYTAAMLHMDTRDLAEVAQPGCVLYGISDVGAGELVVLAGGVAIHLGNEVIGAIGVSGGSVEQDDQIARQGTAVISFVESDT